jgi:hypothetical protein
MKYRFYILSIQILLILILIALAGLTFMIIPQESEMFSSIYFHSPQNLARNSEKSVPIVITFSILNNEDRDMVYTYAVSQENYRRDQLLYSRTDIIETQFVPKGSVSVVTQVIELAQTNSDMAKFTVLLMEKNQQVHFWARIYDRETVNKTIYCGVDVTGHDFDDIWDRNDPVITRGMAYCD